MPCALICVDLPLWRFSTWKTFQGRTAGRVWSNARPSHDGTSITILNRGAQPHRRLGAVLLTDSRWLLLPILGRGEHVSARALLSVRPPLRCFSARYGAALVAAAASLMSSRRAKLRQRPPGFSPLGRF